MSFDAIAVTAVLAQTGSGIRIPFDPATDVIYVLVGLTLFLVWYGDRRTRRAREDEENDSSTPPAGGEPGGADGAPKGEGEDRSSSG